MNEDEQLRDLVGKMYRPRIVDSRIQMMLAAFGGVLITGPKWCGKSWTGAHHTSSSLLLGVGRTNKYAELSPNDALTGEYPRLVDEWQDIPDLWDYARRRIDWESRKGMYVFTGSSFPKKETHHTGTGRFARVKMRPMSLFESGDSNGIISLSKLFINPISKPIRSEMDYKKIIRLICRGGWPSTLDFDDEAALEVPFEYIQSIISTDLSSLTGARKDPDLTGRLLKSLARNSASVVKLTTLTSDVSEDDRSVSEQTVRTYVDSLKQIFLLEEQYAWLPSLRSKTRLRTSPKVHFTDPSLAVAALETTPDILIKDANTAGFFFESLCYRDLCVYASAMKSKVYYYRESNGLEIDNIIERPDGSWGAMEVKLGDFEIDKAAKNLMLLNEKVKTKASFLAVITATGNLAYTRDDGVSVIPIDLLGP